MISACSWVSFYRARPSSDTLSGRAPLIQKFCHKDFTLDSLVCLAFEILAQLYTILAFHHWFALQRFALLWHLQLLVLISFTPERHFLLRKRPCHYFAYLAHEVRMVLCLLSTNASHTYSFLTHGHRLVDDSARQGLDFVSALTV